MIKKEPNSENSWVRTNYCNYSNSVYRIGSAGVGHAGMDSVNFAYAVRPAFHLNLNKVQEFADYTVYINNAQGIEDDYYFAIQRGYAGPMPTVTPPTRVGYTFAGYYTGENGQGTKYYNADGTSAINWNLSTDLTLFAHWIANNYTIIYDGNGALGGSMSSTPCTYDVPQKLNANTFTRGDYPFLGWSLDKNAIAPTYQDGATVVNLTAVNNENLKLYAIWALPEYSLTCEIEGGGGKILVVSNVNVPQSNNFKLGTELTLYANALYGFTFMYWEANGLVLTEEQKTSSEITITITENTTVKAHFSNKLITGINVSATKGGQVYLVGDDFDNLAMDDDVIFAAKIALEGYRFVGWRDIKGNILSTEISIKLKKSQVLDNIITAVFESVSNESINDGVKNE